ncbi:MAG: glycosyltransferase family 4 protein [Terriglobia bacterium]
MRILLFSNWFPPIVSGSSYYTSSLARALTARGHEAVVVTLDWGAEHPLPSDLPFPVYTLPGIKIPKLPMFYNLKLMGFACTPRNKRRLREIIRRHRIQVLHHVNHIFDSTLLTASAARAEGIPVVGSITTPIQHENPVKQWIMGVGDRATVGLFGVRRWDGVVSLDRQVHRYVGNLYGQRAQQRSVVIPFGVRWESMPLYDHDGTTRSVDPQILMVGHIHPFRNPTQLVRAMPLVLKALPAARLVLAGRVDLKEPVDVARNLGMTEAQVRFLGPTSHEQTVCLMKESHIFASWASARYKGLGTAPMEAMLCQTPVINDLPEDLFGEGKLKNGENIVLVDSRDPRSIAEAIIRLLSDDNLRQRIGAAGRRFVLENLGWEGIAEQMEHFYAQVLSRHALTIGKEVPPEIETPR